MTLEKASPEKVMQTRVTMKWRKLLPVKMRSLSPDHQTKPWKLWIRMSQPVSALCEALLESQNMPVLDDDDNKDDGIGEDIADEVVVNMLKGAPNKLTIDMISLDMLD